MDIEIVWRCRACFKEHKTEDQALACCPPVLEYICGKCGMPYEDRDIAARCHLIDEGDQLGPGGIVLSVNNG